MELKNFWITGTNGAAIAHPQATVYLPGTDTLASGLKDQNGDALTNPFTGSDRGHVQFAAADGRYDLRIVGGGREYTQRIAFSEGDLSFRIGCLINPPATDGELLLLHAHTRAVTYPANFAGSRGSVIGAPTAETVYTVLKVLAGETAADGAVVGSITFGTDGSFTFATTGGAALNFAAGDGLGIKAQEAADTTAACAITILGGA